MDGKKKVTVRIFGDDYIMIGGEDENEILYAARRADEYLQAIANSNHRYNKTMTAVLGVLNLIDAQKSMEGENKALKEEITILRENSRKPTEELEKVKNELAVLKQQYNRLQSEMNQSRLDNGVFKRELEKTKESLIKANYEVDISKETIEDLQGKVFEDQIEILKLKKDLDVARGTFGGKVMKPVTGKSGGKLNNK